MAARLRHPLVVLGVQAAAFRPVWGWYVARIRDGSDDSWCVLALVTAVALAWAGGGAPRTRIGALWPLTVLTLLYAMAAAMLPPIFSAAVAILSVGATLSYYRQGRFFQPGLCGLLVLAAPLHASLQFYLGYPLRVVVGQLASPLLALGGFAVAAQGTLLDWGGRLVEIDAPCSGVRMLWAAFFLTFALAAHYRFGWMRTAAVALATLLIVMVGNAFRAAALFYLEAGVVEMPGWAHPGVGLVVFALLCLAIARCAERLRESPA